MDAWQVYLDEFRMRGEKANSQQFARQELLTEAAHDAYQAAADRMTREFGWEDAHTLVVMRGLNEAVRDWLKAGDSDWDSLGRELYRREQELRNGFGGTPPPRA
jgi:predicted glycosyl hydrolase (DUF1957 family)